MSIVVLLDDLAPRMARVPAEGVRRYPPTLSLGPTLEVNDGAIPAASRSNEGVESMTVSGSQLPLMLNSLSLPQNTASNCGTRSLRAEEKPNQYGCSQNQDRDHQGELHSAAGRLVGMRCLSRRGLQAFFATRGTRQHHGRARRRRGRSGIQRQ